MTIVMSTLYCKVCEMECGDNFIPCRICRHRVHLGCCTSYSFSSSTSFISDSYSNYVCMECIPLLVPSFLGPCSPPLWELLSKVAFIQRNEALVAHYQRNVLSDGSRRIGAEIWNHNIFFYRAVIQSATDRLLLLQLQKLPHELHEKVMNTLQSSPSSLIAKERALEFMQRTSKEENLKSSSLEEMRGLAILAAAFLYVYEQEVGDSNGHLSIMRRLVHAVQTVLTDPSDPQHGNEVIKNYVFGPEEVTQQQILIPSSLRAMNDSTTTESIKVLCNALKLSLHFSYAFFM